MTVQSPISELDRVSASTDLLYRSLAECLTNIEHDGSARSQLAMTMCTIAIEHGISQRVLIQLENVASAAALLRVQFETVTRALWLHFAANDLRIAKFAELIDSRSLKEPA